MEKVNSFASSRQTYLKCVLSALGIYLMHSFRPSSFPCIIFMFPLNAPPCLPPPFSIPFPPFPRGKSPWYLKRVIRHFEW